MTRNDFIFSHQRKHRVARHVVFWFLWCIAFNLLFHFPIHVFKGWDTSGPGTRNFQELGPVKFFIKSLIVNSFLGVIVPQMAFSYAVIYWLLPNYFFKKKNRVLVTIITISTLLVLYATLILFKYSPAIYNQIAGTTPGGIPSLSVMHRYVIIDQIGSLPIVLGFLLMIRLVKRWWLKQKETEQLEKEKTKAELRLLKAQVHPHFLFNTINNIYFFTLTNSTLAPEMIRKLTGMLNYIINEGDQPLVPLEKEIRLIQDYMALEKIRYAEHMQLTINIRGDYDKKMIAPLLLIPFVENSFKHGASKMITQPWIELSILIDGDKLVFSLRNSKPSSNEPTTTKGNIGLKNVSKRLELLYPEAHILRLIPGHDTYSVYLELQLQGMKAISSTINDAKPKKEYAVA